MAGAGYKLFNTGDVLTAAQVNTYLQEQTVMVFANSTARTTALSGVLAEGMVSYLQDTNAVEVYNGSAWVGVSGAGDVTEVQAGTGISVASGTGPIPVVTNTMATAIDAKGDLVVGTGADTFARLAVGGTNGHSLQVDSSTATGLKWAAAAGGNLTIAQIATGTLSGTSVTFSSLSTYNEIYIALSGINLSATGTPNLRINGNTGNNYTTYWTGQSGANTYGSTFSGSRVFFGGNDDWKSGNTSNNSWVILTNCKASGFTTIEFITKYTNSAGNVAETTSGRAIYIVSEAVSSIDLLVNGTITFNAGSYTIWGG